MLPLRHSSDVSNAIRRLYPPPTALARAGGCSGVGLARVRAFRGAGGPVDARRHGAFPRSNSVPPTAPPRPHRRNRRRPAARRETRATPSAPGSIPEAARSPATRSSPGATPRTTATSTLQFHLYYNAWRNSGSTWMRERRSQTDPRSRSGPRRTGAGSTSPASGSSGAAASPPTSCRRPVHRARRWRMPTTGR